MSSDEQQTTGESHSERQVKAVQAVTTWLTEVTRSPELDPIRRDGVHRIVHMITVALDNPDRTLAHYATAPPADDDDG